METSQNFPTTAVLPHGTCTEAQEGADGKQAAWRLFHGNSERKFGSPRWPRSVANAPVEDGSFGFIGYPNFSEFNLRRCQRMMSELSQSFLSSFFDHECGVTKVGPEKSRAVKIWKKCFPQIWYKPSSRASWAGCHKKIPYESCVTGWWYTYPSEKWWSSSVGMMKFPIYGKS